MTKDNRGITICLYISHNKEEASVRIARSFMAKRISIKNRNKPLPTLIAFLLLGLFLPCHSQVNKATSFPPVFAEIPDLTLDENTKAERVIDLWKFISDPDTPISKILFSVMSSRESSLQGSARVSVDLNRYINVLPDQNWTGEENIIVEANDGTNMASAAFKVTVRSTEAGQLIDAEDKALVERRGAWVEMADAGKNWLQSSHAGDSLRLKWKGSFLTLSIHGGDLNILQRYYASPKYDVMWESWKTYSPGIVTIHIDGKSQPEIDLSETDKRGWNEFLVASGLEPKDHELEISVKRGFVCIDKIRVSSNPLNQLDISAKDEYQTPLADIVLKFLQGGILKTILRTTPEGRIPTFFGLNGGAYEVEIEPDSNHGFGYPGNTQNPSVEENLVPQELKNVEIKAGQSSRFDFVLKYESTAYRSLEIIQRPIGSVPAILKKGSLLEIECRYPKSPRKTQVFLFDKVLNRELKIISAEYGSEMIMNKLDPGVLIRARIPEGIAEGFYSIRTILDGQEDQASRAVRIISDFKKRYRFIHLSDPHIQGTKDSRDHDEKLRLIAKEINLFSPEFVIITGDIADDGTRPEYLRFGRTLTAFEIPTFVIPGNHDHYFWISPYQYYGFDEYGKYVGQKFYSFPYGEDYFIGVDMGAYEKIYETPLEGIHSSQWPWLIQELEHDKNNKEGLLCVFAHYDFTQGVPEAYGCSNQLVGLFNSYPIDLYLWGHGHANLEKKVGKHPTLSIETGSTIEGTYRVVEIENSRIIDNPAFEAGRLKLIYAGKNDGTEKIGQATLRNENQTSFKDLRMRFLLKTSERGYQTNRGRIIESSKMSDKTKSVVVVSIDISPLSKETIQVSETKGKSRS